MRPKVVGHSSIDVLAVPEGGKVGWNRILCAIDGSPFGETALERALALARLQGGEMFVVSATDLPPEFCEEIPAFAEGLVKETRMRVKSAEERLKRENVAVRCFLKEGSAYGAILDLATEKNVDVIVIGSHDRTGFKRLLMGSVVERVLARTPSPVLVVKNPSKEIHK